MISVNYLRTKVLATSDDVIFHAPTDHNMDPRTINQSIIIAERRFIKPALGSTLYNTLVATKNILVTPANIAMLQATIDSAASTDREPIVLRSGDYVNSDGYFNTDEQLLWQEHLAKLVAEAVYFVTLPPARSRLGSRGLIKNFPEIIGPMSGEAVSADLRDLKHLMDRSLQDRISPLLDDMHDYMCEVGFRGYERDCGCNDGRPKGKKTDIVFGLYDSDAPCGCNGEYPDDDSSSSSSSSGGCVNEAIPFSGVSFVDVNWTPARRACFGEGAVIQVEILNSEGEAEVVTVDIEPDSIFLTTMYHIDLGGENQTGRVLIS